MNPLGTPTNNKPVTASTPIAERHRDAAVFQHDEKRAVVEAEEAVEDPFGRLRQPMILPVL